ncbi:MAG: recombination protein RecR [Bdellovibrionales bacterium]|nr:recombination protein RecR [Bdellovibrionales bacterium]
MHGFPSAMKKLVKELTKLPTIGEKSAVRLAYHLINNDRKLAHTLSEAMIKAANEVSLCKTCFFFTEVDECDICRSTNRDNSVICVVEKPMDLIAIERTGEYKGLYHVLHGLWAPLRGLGPESMRLKELAERARSKEIKEVILATSATVEGDATSLYVARMLSELGIKTSRLAQGIPKGGELEYADEVTLSRAFSGRNEISL